MVVSCKMYMESVTLWSLSSSTYRKCYSFSCIWLFATPSTVTSVWNSLGGNTGEGSYSLREGNGTPLQYSCLENPMDGGAS